MDQFIIELKVRDYELDLQGIVNNSVYQNYLEHARHEYLQSQGIKFAELHNEGKDLIVSKIEIQYKNPLKSGDRFKVTIRAYKKGHLRIVFVQNIIRIADEKLMVKASVIGVCLYNGKPVRPEDIIDLKKLGIKNEDE